MSEITKATNVNTYRALRHIAGIKVKAVPQAAKNSKRLKNTIDLAGERASNSTKELATTVRKNNAIISAFGVEHEGISKAAKKDTDDLWHSNATPGRHVATQLVPGIHGAVAGRKGKKLEAAGAEFGGALVGGPVGVFAATNYNQNKKKYKSIKKAQKRTGVRQFTGSNASAGRKATSVVFPAYHGAIVGKPGKKLKAVASEVAPAWVGSVAGSALGARVGGVPGALAGSLGGTVAGGLAGTNYAQNRGFYSKQKKR